MRDHEEEFRQQRASILVVTFEAGYLAQEYARESGLTWPLIVDQERELYRGYGMLAASFSDVWGWRSQRFYLGELLKGHLPKPSSGDIYQRGGNVLIDPDGIVRMHHIGSGPADRPPVEAILGRIRTASP